MEKHKKYNFIHDKEINLKYDISCLANYKNTEILLISLINGSVNFVNTMKGIIIKSIFLHKGNVTSLGFISNYEYFYTTSGSFNSNHDNCLKINRIQIILKEIMIKKIKIFNNLHGKNRGIINCKSTNKLKDYILITSGGIEDKNLFIIDSKKKEKLFKIRNNFCIYNFNLLFGNDIQDIIDKYFENENSLYSTTENKYLNKKYSDYKAIIGNSSSNLILIIYKLLDNKFIHKTFILNKLSNQNGNYKNNIELINISDIKANYLFVGNFLGFINYYKIEFN